MKNNRVGEFELIKKLTKNLPKKSANVIKGVGDDCAVIKTSNKNFLLATCDCQVENVHFVKDIAKPEEIGQKAAAVNISDIAAMGGKPTCCLVSLIIPKEIDEQFIERLYQGIVGQCGKYKIQIIGGNISKGKELIIDIFMLGEAKENEIIYRSGAKPGDKILVTGVLGEATGGLIALKDKNIKLPAKEKNQLIKRQITPQPRLSESIIIARTKTATSMIDISDGLTSDLLHICDQSKVGIEIWEEKLPISSLVYNLSKKIKKDPLDLALYGGEDYELLFTCSKNAVDELIRIIKEKTGTKATVIGEILEKKKGRFIILKNGKKERLEAKGWDHFKK